jgi:hypothetical protein
MHSLPLCSSTPNMPSVRLHLPICPPPILPLTPTPQSRGADPSILTDNYDPYLNPGKKLPVEVAVEEGDTRAKLIALEKKYAQVHEGGVCVSGWVGVGWGGMGVGVWVDG